MNACPLAEYMAPRATSTWPPLDDQYFPATVSDAHWPIKSTSVVALIDQCRHHLARAQLLAGAGYHAGLHEFNHAGGQQFGVYTQVAVPGERMQQRVGDAADTDLDGGAVRHPFT